MIKSKPKRLVRKLTASQREKLRMLQSILIIRRGQVIEAMTTIESTLHELIIYNFIKRERGRQFFNILLWEDFPLRTQIKLFAEIPLPDELKVPQKTAIKNLEKLATVRNKFAHRISLVSLKGVYLIDKEHKPFPVDDIIFNKFMDTASSTLDILRRILMVQKGVDPKDVVSVALDEIDLDKVEVDYP